MTRRDVSNVRTRADAVVERRATCGTERLTWRRCQLRRTVSLLWHMCHRSTQSFDRVCEHLRPLFHGRYHRLSAPARLFHFFILLPLVRLHLSFVRFLPTQLCRSLFQLLRTHRLHSLILLQPVLLGRSSILRAPAGLFVSA